MAVKKETDTKSRIKAAVKEIAAKTTDKVKKVKTATETAAKEKVAKVAAKKTATKTATLKTMKDAEEKAVKAVAKVKKAAATKVSKISAEVKKVAAKKTTAKTSATKSTATKAPVKTVATKTATVKSGKAAEKEAVSMAQSFDAEYLVLMQKDPNWMHAFWEVSENRINEAKKGKGKIVLRLFDVSSDLTVQRGKKRKFRDIEVPANARSWYVENTAGKSCVAVLGTVSGKNFKPIVESAPVMTFDKSAAAPAADDAFAKASLGGNTLGNFMSSGFSSQTAESWLKQLGGNFLFVTHLTELFTLYRDTPGIVLCSSSGEAADRYRIRPLGGAAKNI